jgi:hypothetical protein
MCGRFHFEAGSIGGPLGSGSLLNRSCAFDD